MENPNVQVKISTIEERKGLLGKLFPRKEVVKKVLNFDNLPDELKNKAKYFNMYFYEAKKYERRGHPYSETMTGSATNAGFGVINEFRKSYNTGIGERVEVMTRTNQGNKIIHLE